MTNAADKDAVRESARKAKELAKRQRADTRAVLDSPEGRRVVWRMLERAGIFRSSFTGNSSTTVFNEGMRNLGLMLMSDINEACPEKYLVMLNESRQRREDDADDHKGEKSDD